MNKPITIKYNNKSNNRDFNIFTEEYFGGSDVTVYFGGVKQRNIAHIQYGLQERQKPVYGYGSNTYDTLAVGDRLVVGAYKIPVENSMSSGLDNSLNGGGGNARGISTYSSNSGLIPEWVYNYNVQEDASEFYNNPVMQRSDIDVYDLQRVFNMPTTGILDFDTKVAIAKRREDFSYSAGCYIDHDLMNTIEDKTYKAISNGQISVYASPHKQVRLITIMSSVEVTILASSEDFYLIRESVRDQVGYVGKEDVRIV